MTDRATRFPMIKFLMFMLLITLVMRWLFPFLLRLLLGRLVRAQQARPDTSSGGGFGGGPASQSRPGGRSGEVRVDYAPPPKKREPRPGGYKGGEYVEFEEVR